MSRLNSLRLGLKPLREPASQGVREEELAVLLGEEATLPEEGEAEPAAPSSTPFPPAPLQSHHLTTETSQR